MPKKKILIVEDEEEICKYIREMIERKGWQAFVAPNGQEAMALFQKEKPQGCIIDIHLTHSAFDGMEVLRRVKEAGPDTVCVMVTCVDEDDSGEEAKRLGAKAYFAKPLDYDEMCDLIEQLN